ncbi:MAG: Lrp/AsnC family transcriptional regulator [Acidobacteria bacterium]|nr:Lrp/AsnC family transcriptional regulator [Acidobacteriota bacterium]
MDPERLLDETGLEILRALQDNARISFAELGRRVGLSGPAITDRIRKMEDEGIISGYHARVNPAKVGFPVTAYARLRVTRPNFQQVITLARNLREVRECHRASGDDDFLIKLIAPSREDLTSVFEQFRQFGEVHVSVVLSTPVEKYAT